MKIYLVGGAVRDKLLDLPVTDHDWVVVGATPEQLSEQGYLPVGKDFPVFLHPDTKEEYALARTERKTAKGYHGFEFSTDIKVTLEQDLARRDLTINAMAEDDQGNLIDPFNGREDLDNALLRHVSPAFAEDPVRILRVARFAARYARWGFKVAHGTHKLMLTMVENGEVDALVAERVWAETIKALGEEKPGRYFDVLHACGALARVFPLIELSYPLPDSSPDTVSVKDDGSKHGADKNSPAVAALDRTATETDAPLLRFAVFMCALFNKTDAALALQQMRDFAIQLKLPNDYRDLSLLAIRTAPGYQDLDTTSAEACVEFLYQADAFRHQRRFAELLDTLRLFDITRNTDTTEKNTVLHESLAICNRVNTNTVLEMGLQGADIGKELKRRRIMSVADSRRDQTDP